MYPTFRRCDSGLLRIFTPFGEMTEKAVRTVDEVNVGWGVRVFGAVSPCYATGMAIKAVAVDDENTEHLIIGLNRENIESLLRGDVFTLPRGVVPTLVENRSDIVLLFAETDQELAKRFPPSMRPM